MKNDPQSTWSRILAELRPCVPTPSYVTWFKDTICGGFDGSTLIVSTPDASVAETLELRMGSLIHEAAARVLGKPVEVLFESRLGQDPRPEHVNPATGEIVVDFLEEFRPIWEEMAPAEIVARLNRNQLAQYIGEELGDSWPDRLIEEHGFENVRRTLTGLVLVHGHGLRKGKFDRPAGFFRWNLATGQPIAGARLNGRRRWFAEREEAASQGLSYREYFRR